MTAYLSLLFGPLNMCQNTTDNWTDLSETFQRLLQINATDCLAFIKCTLTVSNLLFPQLIFANQIGFTSYSSFLIISNILPVSVTMYCYPITAILYPAWCSYICTSNFLSQCFPFNSAETARRSFWFSFNTK